MVILDYTAYREWRLTTGGVFGWYKKMVREGGVEPPHRKAPDPKSGASTSSATLASNFQSSSISPR